AGPPGGEGHELGPPHRLLGCIAIPRQRLQAAAISAGHGDGNSCAHVQDSHAPKRSGNPLRDSNVRFDPLEAPAGLARIQGRSANAQWLPAGVTHRPSALSTAATICCELTGLRRYDAGWTA